jgi:hypothetical protein
VRDEDQTITYSRHVAAILRDNCVSCHRPGEVGPFSLLTYRDAARRADFIREITASRRMPPWKPRPGYGVFRDTLRLTDRELEILARWAEAGAPQGDPAELERPAPAPTPAAEGWQLGQPDFVYTMAQPSVIPSSGDDEFRSFTLPLPLDRDQQVVGIELRPDNRKVVHHAALFVVPAGSVQTGARVPAGVPLWEWTPGTIPRRFPPGVGLRLSSGSGLVLLVRYHPSGKPETDQSSIGISLSKQPLERFLVGIPLGTSDLDIPAGARRHKVVVKASVPADTHAYTLMPHAHLLLREMTLTVTRPDGTVQCLLWIDDWDFTGQAPLHFTRPVSLPRGTVLELVGTFDNSAGNPRNPNVPPRRVRFGPASTDEMLGCPIQVIPDRPQDDSAFRTRWPQGL